MMLDDIDPALPAVDKREAYPVKIDPQSELTSARYWQIYTDYTTKHRTIKQLAEDAGYSVAHVQNIIRWCAKELENTPAQTYRSAMVDKVSAHLQKLERVLERGSYTGPDGKEYNNIPIKDQVSLFKEIRLAMQLLGRTQGAIDEEGDGNRPINIILPNLGRGEGATRVVNGDPYQD